MGFNVTELVITMSYLLSVCEPLWIFKHFQNLQLDSCPKLEAKVTSKVACVRLCVDQGITCNAFTFSRPDSLCSLCLNGDGNTSLTFRDGVGVDLKRKDFDKCNYSLVPKPKGYIYRNGLTSGHVFYVLGRFVDKRGFQIEVYNDTAYKYTCYRFAINDTTQTVQLSNKLGPSWQILQEVPTPFVVNVTFELHILFKTSEVISYVNRIHFNTYVHSTRPCSGYLSLSMAGYLYIEDFSI